MEPPSPTLAAALRDLRLATPRDLKRAAARCRSFARDLPTFDCIWIDALLSLRRLTPFQAERLQDGDADRLRIGPYVLVDRLGRGPNASTFLGRPVAGGPTVVLKQVRASEPRDARLRVRLDELVAVGHVLRSPHVVSPHQVLETEAGLVTVSRFVPGRDARTIVMRHGGMSGDAVAEVALQLAGGIAEAHRAGVPHGEVRIANLRITKAGEAVLVDHGVAAAASPVLLVDSGVPPEAYDGIAPELIGTSATATAASDIYGLGCLLWQLLAGRPPFAMGDPLAKLAAHRTKRVPDVRDFSPEASNDLARLIAEMTDPLPERRTAGLEGIWYTLRRGARPGRTALRQTAVNRPRARFPWSIAAAGLLALSGLSVSLFDHGGTAAILRTALGEPSSSVSQEPVLERTSELSALPTPDAEGTIVLEHAGPYAAADIAFRGPLVLRGRPEQAATIIVTDRPLHLWAESVVLENVGIRHRPSNSPLGGTPALVLVEAQNLTIRSCRFDSPLLSIDRRGGAPAAVAWRSLDRADPTAGRIEVQDTAFRGAREAIFAADRLRRLQAENVLAVGQRTFLSLGGSGGASALALRNVTLRDSVAVLSSGEASAPRRIDVTAEDCVIALAPGGTLLSEEGASSHLHWVGIGVFSSGDIVTHSAAVKTADASATAQSGDGVEGVVRADIVFAGPPHGTDAASVARVSGAPRLTGRSPGFDLSRLPREAAVAGQAR